MEKPRSFWIVSAIGAAVLSALLGLYVGAYCCMMEPLTVTFVFDSGGDVVVPVYSWNKRANNLSSSAASEWDPFFEPIHRIDRRLRPHVWEAR